jgi:hypothetical protein
MRIAQVAPLAERVPPELYGGTERVVSALTEELVRRGHEVTLFASGDSLTSATLVPVTDRALRLDPDVRAPHAYTLLQLGLVFEHAADFDLIHNHLDYFAWPFARLVRTPVVTTLHGRLDLPDLPRSSVATAPRPSSRSATTSARRSRGPTGWRRSTTASTSAPTRSLTAQGTTSPSSGASPRRRTWRGRSRSPARPASR